MSRPSRLLKTLTPVIPMLITATACSDTCTENKNAVPLAGFYASGSGIADRISVDSVEVIGAGMPADSALSAASVRKDELYLPFRIDSDTTTYIFAERRRDAPRESTVRFIYSRTPRFVSVECGVSYIFDIRKIVCEGTLIDSVVCPTGFIDNTNAENIRIFFAGQNVENP